MDIKDKLALTTDSGQSWKGLFYLAGPVIFSMPDDWERTALITVWFLCMAWVSWLTRGNVHPEIAEEVEREAKDTLSGKKRLKDILDEGRM